MSRDLCDCRGVFECLQQLPKFLICLLLLSFSLLPEYDGDNVSAAKPAQAERPVAIRLQYGSLCSMHGDFIKGQQREGQQQQEGQLSPPLGPNLVFVHA